MASYSSFIIVADFNLLSYESDKIRFTVTLCHCYISIILN